MIKQHSFEKKNKFHFFDALASLKPTQGSRWVNHNFAKVTVNHGQIWGNAGQIEDSPAKFKAIPAKCQAIQDKFQAIQDTFPITNQCKNKKVVKDGQILIFSAFRFPHEAISGKMFSYFVLKFWSFQISHLQRFQACFCWIYMWKSSDVTTDLKQVPFMDRVFPSKGWPVEKLPQHKSSIRKCNNQKKGTKTILIIYFHPKFHLCSIPL